MCYQPRMGFPCRECLECARARASEWALRCHFETLKFNSVCCFITLTYADIHPKFGTLAPIHLRKEDLQDFWKRLRKKIKCDVRYFAVGEYGDKKMRPHFHAVLFGYNFPDKFRAGSSPRGHPIYGSETLEKVWGHGHITIQDVTMASSVYCAKYSAKPKWQLPLHLRDYPEFNVMSLGLGVEEILKNMDTYIKTDEIYVDGRAYRIPQLLLDKYFRTDEWKNPLTEISKKIKELEQDINSDRKVGKNNQKSVKDLYDLYDSTKQSLLNDPEYGPLVTGYESIKNQRIEKARNNELSVIEKTQLEITEILKQKKYRAENRQKRLSKTL